MKKNIQVKDNFVVLGLRNCGYTNNTAIADIIDNSIEPDVGSSMVNVVLQAPSGCKAEIEAISIYDNGVGMTPDILEEAMCLGSQTGKSGVRSLGMYGAGLKTASFSIGRMFEVFTKRADSDTVSYASIDLTDAIENGSEIQVDFQEFDTANLPDYVDLSMFAGNTVDGQQTVSGTLVRISKLDKLVNKNHDNFCGRIKADLGLIFNKYIFSKNVTIKVDGAEVVPVDPMPNSMGECELLNDGVIDVDGHTIKYKCYWIPDDLTENRNGARARNQRTQGLYIYRQHRLVGQGVWLGLEEHKHNRLNGFRAEIFVDGTCDYLFGSSFTKMLSDRDKELVDQELRDKLVNELGPTIKLVAHRGTKEMEMGKPDDPETTKAYDDATVKQNSNLLLSANRHGENNKSNEPRKEHEHRGPQANPNPTRERKNKWLGGFCEYKGGKSGEMHYAETVNNVCTIYINVEHPFYTEFFAHLPKALKIKQAQIISCNELAKRNINYFGSDVVATSIDEFLEKQANEIGKSLA